MHRKQDKQDRQSSRRTAKKKPACNVGGKTKPAAKQKVPASQTAGDQGLPQRDFVGRSRVVVLFATNLNLPYDDTVEDSLRDQGIGDLELLRADFPGLLMGPLFRSLAPVDLARQLRSYEERVPGYTSPPLMSLYAIDAPLGSDFSGLAEALRTWSGVERSYVKGPPGPGPMAVTRMNEVPEGPNQHHLDDADSTPVGIGAAWAWRLAGGDGAGVQFVDVEKGWNLKHEDLAGHFTTPPDASPLFGDSLEELWHGTRSLGVVVALDNDKHCIGVAPNVDAVFVSSTIKDKDLELDGSFVDHTADAILATTVDLKPGDVLLLETQAYEAGFDNLDNVPSEIDYDVYAAVESAVSGRGLIVVAAAGNGGHDLDTLLDDLGHKIFNPLDPNYRDSGAILVASSEFTSIIPKTMTPKSNTCYGSRIDCFSWGHDVVTLSTDIGGTEDATTVSNFQDTSAAAAIVAGAAVVVQGISKAVSSTTLDGPALRTLLSSSDLNTKPAGGAEAIIGYQPDLKRIARDGLQAAPDVYLRDHVGDDGSPHIGKISASPDVILRQNAVAGSLSAAFGEISNTGSKLDLGQPAIEGATNYLYVRARNRGGSVAKGLQAHLHWTPPSSLAMPALWNSIGTTDPIDIPPGNQLTVLPELAWDTVPEPGHYCFIAELTDPWDAAPPSSTIQTLPDFKNYIRAYNNITWRNFNVVGPTVQGGGSPGGPGPADYDLPDLPAGVALWLLPFHAVGAPDGAHEMQLEVLIHAPSHMLVGIEMPLDLYHSMRRPRHDDFISVSHQRALVRLPSFGNHVVLDGVWAATRRHPCRMLMALLPGHSVAHATVAVRQIHAGVEVGRVSWQTRPTQT